MKRFFRIFAVAALACATFVACENKFDDYDPAQAVEGAQAYFSNENAKSFTISKANVTPIAITVMRGESAAAVSVPIRLTQGEEAAFSAPEKVDFKAGQNKTTINVTCDPEKVADGKSYKVTLTIGDESITTPYGNNEITITVKIPEPWKSLGMGQFTDDAMAPLYSIAAPTREVEIFENANYPGCIFLKDAYGLKYWVDVFGIKESSLAGFPETYLKIDVSDPNKVVIEKQSLLLNLGDGLNYIYTDYEGLDTYGTFKDGIITFPVGSVYIEDDDGSYDMNGDGLYRIVMPGVELADFSLEMSYAGMNVDANYEATPVIDVVFGADVAQIAYAVVPENIVYDEEGMAAALAGIEDGSIELTVVDAVDQIDDEEELLQMQLVGAEALEEGIYTMIAIPVNAAEELQMNDIASVAFYMNAVNSEVPAIDFKAALVPFTALFGEVPGYDDSSCMAWIALGSNIKAWKQLLAPYEVFAPFLEKGVTLEQLVLADGSDYDKLQYINTEGEDYGYFTGLDPETDYLMVHYVEDIFGNVKTVGTLATTAAAPEEEDTEAEAKVLRKLDASNVVELGSVQVWNK